LKLQGLKIQNAKDEVSFLQAEINKFHATHVNARRIVNKIFWEVEVNDVDRNKDFNCATIVGRRKAHQVRLVLGQDPTMLEYKDLSLLLYEMHGLYN
jgi:hypothetical protein